MRTLPLMPIVPVLALALAAGCRPRTDGPDGSGTIECTQVRIAPLVAGRLT